MISMSVLHYQSFSPVTSNTHFVHDEWLEISIFRKFPGTAEITCFMMISMSVLHSASLTPLVRNTHFVHDEYVENSIFGTV